MVGRPRASVTALGEGLADAARAGRLSWLFVAAVMIAGALASIPGRELHPTGSDGSRPAHLLGVGRR
jgi:hypothetical protein